MEEQNTVPPGTWRCTLQPPYATSCLSGPYGQIAGSKPDWASSNLTHKGRAAITTPPASLLATGGFQAWAHWGGTSKGTNRRHYHHTPLCQPSPSYAEPVAISNQASYFSRRKLATTPAAWTSTGCITSGLGASLLSAASTTQQQFCGGACSGDWATTDTLNSSDSFSSDPTVYRRSKRLIRTPDHKDRSEGRRKLPEPQGNGGKLQGVKPFPMEVKFPPSPNAAEPNMPRMGRPPGAIPGLRESDQELSFEEQTGRRGKVTPEQLKGQGRAGDLTGRFGVEARVQDDPDYFRTFKDPPGFARFCKTLPKAPHVTCRERHAAGLAAAGAARVQAVMAEVQQLSFKDMPE